MPVKKWLDEQWLDEVFSGRVRDYERNGNFVSFAGPTPTNCIRCLRGSLGPRAQSSGCHRHNLICDECWDAIKP